jgi:hypothetical protein
MKRFLMPLLAVIMFLSILPAGAQAATSSQLISDAKSYIGTPYKWAGTTPSGFDCSGYIQYVFKKSGISLPRTTGQMNATGTAVAKSNLAPGDLVFFNTSGTGVSHAGIYVGSNNFIHASSSKGVMISSVNDPYYWGSRYVGAKRVHNFTSGIIQTGAKVTPKSDPYATRLEIAETLAIELGLTAKSKGTYFTDIPASHPKIKYINAVYEAGIFTGSNGKFSANGKLTRSQMAKVLVEAYGLSGKKYTGFKDVSAAHWAKGYIETLYFNQITTGYENGYYGVNDNVTSTQFDKFVDRAN